MLASQMDNYHGLGGPGVTGQGLAAPVVGGPPGSGRLRAFEPAPGSGSEPVGTVTVVVDKDQWSTSNTRMQNHLDITFSAAGLTQQLTQCNAVAVLATMRGQAEREAMADAIAQVTNTTRGDWLGSGANKLDVDALTATDRATLIVLAGQLFLQNVVAATGGDAFVVVNGATLHRPLGCDS